MSDNTPEVECSLCGRDGYPSSDCGICHGSAKAQSRAHTLSEERANPRRFRDDRYGEDGGVGPRRVNIPGSQPS
jgi:hypothetical protein